MTRPSRSFPQRTASPSACTPPHLLLESFPVYTTFSGLGSFQRDLRIIAPVHHTETATVELHRTSQASGPRHVYRLASTCNPSRGSSRKLSTYNFIDFFGASIRTLP